MRFIRWTTEASNQFEAAVQYIQQDNPEAARKAAQTITLTRQLKFYTSGTARRTGVDVPIRQLLARLLSEFLPKSNEQPVEFVVVRFDFDKASMVIARTDLHGNLGVVKDTVLAAADRKVRAPAFLDLENGEVRPGRLVLLMISSAFRAMVAALPADEYRSVVIICLNPHRQCPDAVERRESLRR